MTENPPIRIVIPATSGVNGLSESLAIENKKYTYFVSYQIPQSNLGYVNTTRFIEVDRLIKTKSDIKWLENKIGETFFELYAELQSFILVDDEENER